VEIPPDIGLLLSLLRDGLVARGSLVGVYLYGSLATGDFSPARSDIDVIVMVEREPDKAAIQELRQLHLGLASPGGAVDRLHCLYVPVETAADPARLHAYWFGDRMTKWQLKVMTQAELAAVGVAFHGPWPPPGIKPVPTRDVQAAVHQEISGYWRRIARKRKHWLQDDWVDHGLIVLPRAEAVLTTGDLITKAEAIRRLADFGVPATLAGEIRRRREGQVVTLSAVQKVRRARLARQLMRRGVRRLSRLDPAAAPGPEL
jgi:predicted nucleotidyltransferase